MDFTELANDQDRYVQISCSQHHCCAIKADGTPSTPPLSSAVFFYSFCEICWTILFYLQRKWFVSERRLHGEK